MATIPNRRIANNSGKHLISTLYLLLLLSLLITASLLVSFSSTLIDQLGIIVTNVAVDAKGNVYVTAIAAHTATVQEFDSQGHYLRQFGVKGQGEGQIEYPQAIKVDSTGNTYVADNSKRIILKFDSSGKFLLSWGKYGQGIAEFESPGSLAIDKEGNVYVADNAVSRVQKFDGSGHYLSSLNNETVLKWPSDLTIAEDNSIFVADSGNNRILKFGGDGRLLPDWKQSSSNNGEIISPVRIAMDYYGFIYFFDRYSSRIVKLDRYGQFISNFSNDVRLGGTLNEGNAIEIHGMAVDRNGNFFLTFLNNNQIQKIDANGKTVATWSYEGVPFWAIIAFAISVVASVILVVLILRI